MDKLERAKELLKSAKFLFENNDILGVAGLSYQAVESGIAHLTSLTNGVEQGSHGKKRQRAEEILKLSRNSLKKLWNARNIDFYGNERIGEEDKELDKKEIEDAMLEAEEIINKVENYLCKKKENDEK